MDCRVTPGNDCKEVVAISDVDVENMKLKRLQEKLAHSEAQADSGEFAEDNTLEGLLAELNAERKLA